VSVNSNNHRYPRRGVYMLANDAVYDIAVAFLNSFRINNPYIDLCLIPFNDDIANLSKLSDIYGFDIFSDREKLICCDEIGQSIMRGKKNIGQFRKFCAFEGPYDEFIYIDCDTIVLKDIYITFQHLNSFDIIFSHSNVIDSRRWVWKDSILKSGLLNLEQINFAANTGFFCSRKEVITMAHAIEGAIKAQPFIEHMELHCVEQPFLNFLVVTSGIKYTSLLTLKRLAPYTNTPLELWAPMDPKPWGRRLAGRDDSEDILLVHWAGCWAATDIDKEIYKEIEASGKRVDRKSLSISMPKRELWDFYRDLNFSALKSRRSLLNLVEVARRRKT